MKITLTKKESEDYFYNALCNAVGTGYMDNYGIELTVNQNQYKEAKAKLLSESKDTCYEDVLMQVLKFGGTLTFEDVEGEGDNTKSITLKEVHERVQNAPVKHLLNMQQEQDDVITADVILQTVFFESVIFG